MIQKYQKEPEKRAQNLEMLLNNERQSLCVNRYVFRRKHVSKSLFCVINIIIFSYNLDSGNMVVNSEFLVNMRVILLVIFVMMETFF